MLFRSNELGLPPGYEEKHFAAEEKRGRLRLIASADGAEGSVVIHQDARIYAALLNGVETLAYPLSAGRRAYVHIARGTAQVSGAGPNAIELQTGDALEFTGAKENDSLRITNADNAELLIFDLP